MGQHHAQYLSLYGWVRSFIAMVNDPKHPHRWECGTCSACCRQDHWVPVDTAEDAEWMDTVPDERFKYGALRRREDYTCVYLVDDRCTIYDRRPETCRVYDCGIYAATGIMPADRDGLPSIAAASMRRMASIRFKTRTDRWIAMALRLAVVDLQRQHPEYNAELLAIRAIHAVMAEDGDPQYMARARAFDESEAKNGQPT